MASYSGLPRTRRVFDREPAESRRALLQHAAVALADEAGLLAPQQRRGRLHTALLVVHTHRGHRGARRRPAPTVVLAHLHHEEAGAEVLRRIGGDELQVIVV